MHDYIEKINAGFINNAKLKKAPQMFRFNQKNMRWYYVLDKQFNPTFYPSITTITGKAMPETENQKYLRGEMGNDKFFTMLRQKGHFGTFIHTEIQQLFVNGYYDFDDMPNAIRNYATSNNLDFDTHNWIFDAPQSMMAFIRFIEDYELEPWGIELPIFYNANGYKFASLIDFVGMATIPKKGFNGEVYKSGKRAGEPKISNYKERQLVIIDWKTGTASFPQHEVQLLLNNMGLKETYGIEAEEIMNVSPTEHRAGNMPNYRAIIQTETDQQQFVNSYLQYFKYNYPHPSPVLKIQGRVTLGEPSWENTEMVEAKEFVKNLSKTQNFINQIKEAI